MRILDQEGNEIQEEDVDYTKGYLVHDVIVIKHHDKVPYKEAKWHEEYVTFYFTDGTQYDVTGPDDPHVGPDGWIPLDDDREFFGADQKMVIDVPEVEEKEAWDETEDIQRYILLTPEQIAQNEAIKNNNNIMNSVVSFARFMAPALPNEQAIECKYLFDKWSGESVSYEKDQRILYNDILYYCVLAHTSQESWKPDVSPSLWQPVLIPDEGEIPDWIQPVAPNGYKKGDKVRYDGKIYESLVDNNTWVPGQLGTESLWKDITAEGE